MPALAADEIVIAALGDSLTQGFGLPEEDGFIPQLEDWLQGEGHAVTLINAGVSGDTTAGGLARVEWTLTDDVDAVIVNLGANDLLRGIDPSVSKSNLAGILGAIGKRDIPVLLVGMRASGNYGPDFKRDFDAMFPALAQAHGTLFYPFYFQGLGEGEDLSTVREFMQPDGIHPNAIGVARIVADMGPFVIDLLQKSRDTD